MPACFDRWCNKFDDLLRTKAQKREFRNYLGGLLGESERKNIYQMASDNLEKSRNVWVATIEVEISRLEGTRKIAIVTDISRWRIRFATRVLMNAATFKDVDDIDYFITNIEPSIVTPQWVVDTYSQRNWVEVLNP